MTLSTELTSGLPLVEDSIGALRVLGCLPAQTLPGASRFMTSRGLVSRDKWEDRDLCSKKHPPPILDQGQSGSCVGHAGCTAFTVSWLLGGGRFRRFSPWFLYGNINGGRDEGAVVSHSLLSLKNSGICFEAEVPAGMINRHQFPSQAFVTAERFRIEEAIACHSFDEIVSAILFNHPVVFGVEIGDRFQPDNRGVLPPRTGLRLNRNHAMCAVGLKWLDNRWHLKVQNSWHHTWGINGYCYMPENYFIGQTDHFAIRVTTEGDVDPLPDPNF